MKKSFKAITSLVLMVLVLMSLSVSAFAAAPSPTASITFRGEKQGFGFRSDDMNYTATDLFDSFKNVMPGDNLTESISFTYAPQDTTDCDFVNLYMKAVPHDETANPLTYSETFENTDGKDQANVDGQRDETVATMSDFLSKLTMTVKAGGTEIYNTTSGFPMNARPYSGLFVDQLASLGMPLPCVAADDAHEYTQDALGGWLMVHAREHSHEAVMEALREGRFYATQGPSVSLTVSGGVARVTCSPAERVVFYSDAIWSQDRVSSGNGVTQAVCRLQPHETFVRAEVIDSEGRRAFTSPVRV